MVTLIVILLSLMFTFAAISYGLFWYEAANSQYREYLLKISKGRVFTLLLRGILWSVLSQLLVALFYPLHLWKNLWKSQPDNTPCRLPVLVFVHGLYHNMSAWIFYRRWLRRAGFRDIHAWDCLLWKYSFEELIERFSLWMNGFEEKFPGRPIVLVGHSLGGLLVRNYAEQHAAAGIVTGVITLGTPHQGTKTAVFGFSRVCREIGYRSPTIQRMEKNTSDCTIPRMAIYSPIDNVVLPAEALRVPSEAWTHGESDLISHIAMLYHKPTARMMLEFIEKNCVLNGVKPSDPASSSAP